MGNKPIVLREIALTNYGPFRERQEIPIDEDLTVVIGANESGKTLLLHAIYSSWDACRGSVEKVDRLSKFKPQEPAILEAIYEVRSEKLTSRVRDLLRVELSGGNHFTLQYEFRRLPGGSPLLEHKVKAIGKDKDKEVILRSSVEQRGSAERPPEQEKRIDLVKLLPVPIFMNPSSLGQLPVKFSTNVANGETLHKLLFKLGGFFETGYPAENLIYEDDEGNAILRKVAERLTQLALKEWPVKLHLSFTVSSESGEIVVWVGDPTKPQRDRLDERGKGVHKLLNIWLLLHYQLQDFQRHKQRKAQEESAHAEWPPMILLLDEDRVNLAADLHPPAQRTIMKILTKFAQNNNVQIILTTHSPFLVDWNRPDRVRVLRRSWKEGAGTEVISKPYKSRVGADRLAAYEPILTSLGLYLGDFPFMGRKNLIVEGVSDHLILRALIQRCARAGLPAPDLNELSIIPGGGIPELMYLARYLYGCNADMAVLVDNDDKGNRAAKALQQDGLLPAERILRVREDKAGTTEDIVPRSVYVQAVNECYKAISNLHFAFQEIKPEELSQDRTVLEALKDLFKKKFGEDVEPDKVKIAQTLCDLIHDLPEAELQSSHWQEAQRLLQKISDVLNV